MWSSSVGSHMGQQTGADMRFFRLFVHAGCLLCRSGKGIIARKRPFVDRQTGKNLSPVPLHLRNDFVTGVNIFKRGLIRRYTYAIMTMQGGGKPPRKEVEPTSVQEAIALLMLVIAAISLGLSIKK